MPAANSPALIASMPLRKWRFASVRESARAAQGRARRTATTSAPQAPLFMERHSWSETHVSNDKPVTRPGSIRVGLVVVAVARAGRLLRAGRPRAGSAGEARHGDDLTIDRVHGGDG